MTWRLARSLDVLRSQINTRWPARSKASDGTIGDARHAASVSDHNPDKGGVVRALDITHDLSKGPDAGALAETLRRSQDPRIKYLISNRRIASSYPAHGKAAWEWRPYTGSNPHEKHVHISVVADDPGDDVSPWVIEPENKGD